MMRTIILNGLIINEGREYVGNIIIDNNTITHIVEGDLDACILAMADRTIDAEGCWVIPGVIDDQVHFREPGLTHKADIATESRAAVAGGVTSYMDMPNTKPATITAEALAWKQQQAQETSIANYSFYIGATNDNAELITTLDYTHVCGIKLFMGSSTGNMLVDSSKTLEKIFAEAPVLVATHCEEEEVIQANRARYVAKFGEDLPIYFHPMIRNTEACYRSSAKAVELASRHNARLHLLHLSTAQELTLLEDRPLAEKRITGEVCVHHLWFDDNDYATYGNRIKWNPAIKTCADRRALLEATACNRLDIVATDHAPHLLSEKEGSCLKAASGGPLVQYSLQTMLELSTRGHFTRTQVVEKMCHAPAALFGVARRGYLREGYYADIAIIDPRRPYTVTPDKILSRCGWSPLEGHTYPHSITHTLVNGVVAYENGTINDNCRGQLLLFER
ncbi:MAG: dihydroorotase [Bacteroidaceae bacterium]|nr:dihydroorotase [Bacteroidaceae bacterium]